MWIGRITKFLQEECLYDIANVVDGGLIQLGVGGSDHHDERSDIDLLCGSFVKRGQCVK